MALVPMPILNLNFNQHRSWWGFLMHDEESGDDVSVILSARTVQYIKNDIAVDADAEDRKAIEARLDDIQQAASRKFDRGEFEPQVLDNKMRIIAINPVDLDD